MISPYWGANFFQFFSIMAQRFIVFFSGGGGAIASDEIQVIVLIAIAISCGFIGAFLVVRKMTMLANSLSHTILLGLVVAIFFASPDQPILTLPSLLLAALITAIITVALTRLIGKGAHVKEDASIGLSFTTLFALGLICLMLFTRSSHIGTEAIMGNLDALHFDDIKLSVAVALIDALVVIACYPLLKIISFDPGFAKAQRLSYYWIDALFLLLVAVTAIAAFRAVGALLVLAFLTGPILSARLLSYRLPKIIGLSIVFGTLVALVSVALARHFLSVYQMPLSTAGIAVAVIGLLFALVALISNGRFTKFFNRRCQSNVLEKSRRSQ